MNRHRLSLVSGVNGIDVRHDDPTGPYYLVEDVHQLLRRFQLLRFHTAQCRCWDCDALQKDIAETLGQPCTAGEKPECDCEGPQKIGPGYHAPYCATMAGTEFAKRYAPTDETKDVRGG